MRLVSGKGWCEGAISGLTIPRGYGLIIHGGNYALGNQEPIMQKDSIIPSGCDMLTHTLSTSGDFPSVVHTVTFDYADGSQRTYDGANWRLTKPSREVAAQGIAP